MRTVWATQRVMTRTEDGAWLPKFDTIHEAEKFGEIRYVFENKHHAYAPERAADHAREQLEDFRPGDYLLIVGNQTLSALCFGLVASRYGTVMALHWSNRDEEYVPLRFDI